MKIKSIFFIVFFIHVSSIIYGQDEKMQCNIDKFDTIKFSKVSLISLMRNPKLYEGKWIETQGNYFKGFEEYILTDLSNSSIETKNNFVWITFKNELKCINYMQYGSTYKLLLRGKVYLNSQGHLNQYKIALNNVYFVQQL